MHYEYLKIRQADMTLGEPLNFDVVDQEHRLLLSKGSIVASADQLVRLAHYGLFRLEVEPPPPPAIEQVKAAPKERVRHDRTVSLDATHLVVGESIQIQTGSDDTRLYVKCIGFCDGLGLALTMPSRAPSLHEGQEVAVRYFNGRNIYSFTSYVLRLSQLPGPHFWVAIPAAVSSHRIRAQDRVRANLICAVTSTAATHAGVLVNLSTGGASLTLKGAGVMAKGSLVQLNFKLNVGELESIITVTGEVANVTQEPGAPSQYGIRFTYVPSDAALALTAYVYQARAEGMGEK